MDERSVYGFSGLVTLGSMEQMVADRLRARSLR